jgi:hypothetical protein
MVGLKGDHQLKNNGTPISRWFSSEKAIELIIFFQHPLYNRNSAYDFAADMDSSA